MTVISISIRSVYGTERIYPVNDAAEILARIARTKTLTRDNLRDAKALGCTVTCNQFDSMDTQMRELIGVADTGAVAD